MKKRKKRKKLKKAKNRKRQSGRGRLLAVFCTTFIGVVLMGMTVFFLCHVMKAGEDSGIRQAEGEKVQEKPAASGTLQEVLPQEPEQTQQTQDLLEQPAPEEPEPEPQGKYADILADSEYMRENRIYAKETAEDGKVTFAFAGDILFDPGYSIMAKMLQREGGIHDSISEDLMAEMQNADIFMVNNEFPYSDRGTPTPEKQFTFRAKPESAEILH